MSEPKVNDRTRRRSLLLPGFLLVVAMALMTSSARAQEPYSVEPVTAKADAYLPQSVADGLEPQGQRLTTFDNGIKTTVCELWWARNLVTHDAPSTPGVIYGALKPGQFVGVIHYLTGTSEDFREDFRDQKLRPGYYTMRYAVMPQDKDHKDVNPYRDFVLLSPVSVDRDPAKVLDTEELLRLSRFASRSKHPAVMSLVPADSDRKDPVVVRTDDAGTCILQAKLHAQPEKGGPAKDLSLAVIVVTPSKENGAS